MSTKEWGDIGLIIWFAIPIIVFIFIIAFLMIKPCLPFKQWFSALIGMLVLCSISYVGLHIQLDQRKYRGTLNHTEKYGFGYEYNVLNTTQMQEINRIYRPDDTNTKQTEKKGDTINKAKDKTPVENKAAAAKDTTTKCKRDTCSYAKVIMYLNGEFNDKIDSAQKEDIQKYLSYCTPTQATGYLTSLRIRVKSYFWLTGPEVYFEVMFWCIFGVISSLLFSLGNIWKNSTTVPGNPQTQYDPSQVPSQIAKIFYAPICTLILTLGYNYIQDKNMVDISSSKGVIVFSFIAGFYSQRMMAFLDRLKDVILPNTGSADLPESKSDSKSLIKQIIIKLNPENTLMELIKDIGMGTAKVTIENAEICFLTTATKNDLDPKFSFNVNNLQPGKYTIKVSWSGNVVSGEIKAEGEDLINVINENQTFDVNVKKV
jgi:hypothetical protein